MFTGLVEETGVILSLQSTAAGGVRLSLRAPLLGTGVHLGDSPKTPKPQNPNFYEEL